MAASRTSRFLLSFDVIVRSHHHNPILVLVGGHQAESLLWLVWNNHQHVTGDVDWIDIAFGKLALNGGPDIIWTQHIHADVINFCVVIQIYSDRQTKHFPSPITEAVRFLLLER